MAILQRKAAAPGLAGARWRPPGTAASGGLPSPEPRRPRRGFPDGRASPTMPSSLVGRYPLRDCTSDNTPAGDALSGSGPEVSVFHRGNSCCRFLSPEVQSRCGYPLPVSSRTVETGGLAAGHPVDLMCGPRERQAFAPDPAPRANGLRLRRLLQSLFRQVTPGRRDRDQPTGFRQQQVCPRLVAMSRRRTSGEWAMRSSARASGRSSPPSSACYEILEMCC